ncbi:MAG TPA: VIT and VWA domain-containing protein [Pyrinomonadaceae bacterium]|nr:VIT and VWA domain-containing protein [Pyrinomonadaceae bacterium]
MLRRFFIKTLLPIAVLTLAVMGLHSLEGSVASAQNTVTQGSLQVVDPNGTPKAICPLKHTEVKAQISGFLSRVTVTQEFENPFKEKIEAVYTFPLPQKAAVDDMTMLVGDRTVRGKILRREEAEAVYEAAKNRGQTTSLLNQERPNIFTQSVANILPGEQIKITISYVETLKYEDGSYEFVFPMVVGPRYVPGNSIGAQGNGFAPDTDAVPDGSKITPAPAPPGMRAGHDISLDVTLDAGVPIDALNSKTHDVSVERPDEHSARVTLKELATIPNKDFILRYDVAGKKIEDAVLTHSGNTGGFFTLILQPPERVTVEDVTPKELVFVLDTSGSMSGFPIEKAKETMKLALDNLYPADTFNLITFSGDEHILFPEPVPATKENLAKAQAFLETRQGGGGTEMMKAIKASMDPSDKQDHVRIVCFMTDGYVGNDLEIIGEVQKHPNARVFAFGIGNSVNRFLLDNMAKYGRGEVEYVGLNDDGSAAARRFHERVRNPLLTDISVEWDGVTVSDVYPKQIPDLFGAKPVVLTGRYSGNSKGTIRLKGKMSERDFVREIPVDFSSTQSHDVLATLWARTRVDDLMGQDFNGAQRGNMKEDVKQSIIQLGLDYRLMTQFTSFVAVEEMIVTDGGQPRRIDVPVEVPEGVNREAVYGEDRPSGTLQMSFGRVANGKVANKAALMPNQPPTASLQAGIVTATPAAGAGGGGVGTGSGSGVGAGKGAGKGPSERAKAPPPKSNAAGLYQVSDADAERIRNLSPEEKQRRDLQSKFHPSLLAVIDRLKDTKLKPGADEVRFIRDGKAEIQIWLNEKSDETMAKLKELGFEVVLDPKTAKMVIGRLPISKLAALAELKSVRYVAPQFAN